MVLCDKACYESKSEGSNIIGCFEGLRLPSLTVNDKQIKEAKELPSQEGETYFSILTILLVFQSCLLLRKGAMQTEMVLCRNYREIRPPKKNVPQQNQL